MKALVAIFALAVLSALAPVQAATDMTPAEARATVADLAGKLESGYLDPAIVFPPPRCFPVASRSCVVRPR
ncbi:MAG: hypothetical protein GC153_02935 [Alphaproteobacteria bacterium]|nr:hypothetical protein [Alphaproteobacteria bacterium]